MLCWVFICAGLLIMISDMPALIHDALTRLLAGL